MLEAQVIKFVAYLFQIYQYMIIGYILMSWVPNLRESKVGEILGKFVEPVLAPFRKLIPPLGMIDLSPIVALLAVRFASFGAITVIQYIFRMIG